jgi:hypothetical protein
MLLPLPLLSAGCRPAGAPSTRARGALPGGTGEPLRGYEARPRARPMSVVPGRLADMNARWKQQGAYGADLDPPGPGPRQGHEYVELVGGPLDGLLLDVTQVPRTERPEGVIRLTGIGDPAAGAGARYACRPDRPGVWLWQRDTP